MYPQMYHQEDELQRPRSRARAGLADNERLNEEAADNPDARRNPGEAQRPRISPRLTGLADWTACILCVLLGVFFVFLVVYFWILDTDGGNQPESTPWNFFRNYYARNN